MNSRQSFIYKHFSNLIEQFEGKVPFNSFLNNYFKSNPGLGSKDRKILRDICYRVFRFGTAWKSFDKEEIFLWPTNNLEDASPLIKNFYGDLKPLKLVPEIEYPFLNLLSNEIDHNSFVKGIGRQPHLWLRLKNEPSQSKTNFEETYKDSIMDQLELNEKFTSFGLANGTAIDFERSAYEVQDLSSQLVTSKIHIEKGHKVWDCCCGAGGKSLFLAETWKDLNIYCSDIRPKIFQNLKIRFNQKRLKLPHLGQMDISKSTYPLKFGDHEIYEEYFDTIIADVPCSGSGTWSREPDNISFFNEHLLKDFVQKQVKILKHSIFYLKPGGKFYYITCSVFEAENEGVLEKIKEEKHLRINFSEYILGYQKNADNLFIAEIEKLS